MKFIEGGITAPAGFVAGAVNCGIKKNSKKLDLAIIFSEKRCSAAGVYTKNLVKGAPIIVTEQNLADGFAQAVVVNSGNANTCNADGYDKAREMAGAAADMLGIDENDMIVGSTGVIGQPINNEVILKGIAELEGKLSLSGGKDAALAIITTDLAKKRRR